jgi:hypothetical protein
MKENSNRRIAIIGYCEVGKVSLTQVFREKLETTENIKEPNEFELAGFHLTDEDKNKLREMDISANVLVSLTNSDKMTDKLEELSKELKDLDRFENIINKKKTKTWNKKKFYE